MHKTARLFGSRARAALLQLLVLEGRSGSIRQLAIAADVPYSLAHRLLRQLAADGFLRATPVRNSTTYRAADNAVTKALRSLLQRIAKPAPLRSLTFAPRSYMNRIDVTDRLRQLSSFVEGAETLRAQFNLTAAA